jgi:hypothetical protein
MVGDTGFEPVTSTVCKRHKKKGRGKYRGVTSVES